LPEYMVPRAYVVMEELPVGPTGKIDPRALPKPERRRLELEQGYVAPRRPLEQTLADIWAEVLGVEQVGIYDNFFELGGHSLLVSRLASRIRLAFNVEAPLRALFLAPTIAEMSLTVAALQAEQEDLTEIGMMLEELKQLSPEEIEAQLHTEHPVAI
jgi:acyl carrier protein